MGKLRLTPEGPGGRSSGRYTYRAGQQARALRPQPHPAPAPARPYLSVDSPEDAVRVEALIEDDSLWGKY